jgi:DNA replication protein DnaC
MLTENTLTKLHEIRLGVMAQHFRQQLLDPAMNGMAFEERFGLLVDAEWSARKSNRLKRLIHNAHYAISGACVEDIAYHADRKLDKALVARLAACSYIHENHNVIILGATGVGKTYLACAFGIAASRNFFTVRYVRLPDLFSDLALARADGSYRKVIKHYTQVKLLILDEWLLFPLKETEARDLLEIIEARHSSQGSTIFCSQFDVDGWYTKIGEPILAEAVCDRIVHNSYTIVLSGDSMRKRNGIAE